MPGEGSLHQIRVALHLQDVGQARVAFQKPITSQQKPQSRAMAGPCHLVQDNIPSSQCQCDQSSTRPCAAPGGLLLPVLGGPCRARHSIQPLSPGALSPAYPDRACPGGPQGSLWSGHLRQPHRGALPLLRAPPRPPLHGPARRAPAGHSPGTLWDADFLPGDPGRTSGPGSGAYRTPAAPGSRLLLPPGTERGEPERRSSQAPAPTQFREPPPLPPPPLLLLAK